MVNGCEAFPAMLGAIGAARASVDLETYILRADDAGAAFAQALAAAARRGVRVRLIYDAIGSLGLPARFLAPMMEAGVKVAVYHPLHLFGPLRFLGRRDHRKILVVDDQRSFTGGLNIAGEYACGPEGWRDTHVEIDGMEVAGAFTAAFQYVWRRALLLNPPDLPAASGPGVAEPPESPGEGAEPGLTVRLITNQVFGQRRRIRNAYRQAIREARDYVFIENAYFNPDPSFLRALMQAARRGVRVEVVLAAKTDVRLAQLAARAAYPKLLAGGVRIFEWSQTVLHAKTAVIDDRLSFVGSYNFDHRSLKLNLEAVVLIDDRAFAEGLRRQGEADMARCREVTLADCAGRSLLERVKQQLAYRLRSWL